MRRWTLLLATCACSHGGASAPAADIQYHTSRFAEDDGPAPYARAELQQTLTAEREEVARAEHEKSDSEREAGDDDHLRVLIANLAVRRRFVQTLELCDANAVMCPPRLQEQSWSYAADSDTDPPLDAPMRFDLDSWRKVADELYGRACGCRTIDCLDSIDAAIARLELRPMPDVQADEQASLSITRARECTMALRGKRALPKIVED
jgi:hypothetical protein